MDGTGRAKEERLLRGTPCRALEQSFLFRSCRPSRAAPLLREGSHPQVLLAASANELVGLEVPQLLELAGEGALQRLRRGGVVGVRAPGRLGDDLVDHPE